MVRIAYRPKPETLLNAVFCLAVLVAVYIVIINIYLIQYITKNKDDQSLRAAPVENVKYAAIEHVKETPIEHITIQDGAEEFVSTNISEENLYLDIDSEINATVLDFDDDYHTFPPMKEELGEIEEHASLKTKEELEEIEDNASLKTILFWNPFFHNKAYHFGLGRSPFLKHKCPTSTCQTTADRQWLSRADVVVFHTPYNVDPRPEMRMPHQLYALVQREPHLPHSRLLLREYHDMFNLTMTYRLDSDIFLPYGKYVPRTAPPETVLTADAVDRKNNSVVWMVSHCHSLGKREWYVDELKYHIDVDVWGACGDKDCQKGQTGNCFHMFEKEYRYYLAFENTYCQDYVSEKMWRLFNYDLIPIVYGMANYSEIAPEHSVIDIKDFATPKHLADYLHYLNQNTTAYLEYFKWKEKYNIFTSRSDIFSDAFCNLCEILHDSNYVFRDYRNISSWWLDDTCQINFMNKFRHGKW